MLSPCTAAAVIVFCASIPLLNGAVFFPANSAYGIFAALAVPLDLGPHRNVFVSYNFEANYNLPANWQLPAYFEIDNTRRLKGNPTKELSSESVGTSNVTDFSIDSKSSPTNGTFDEEEETEKNEESSKNRERRSLLSRQIFYNMLKQKFKMHGFNGESCLLRMICETNASGLGDINGFLGSVFHIIFAPSSSKDEGISDKYYKAEFDGQQSECAQYQKKCPENILDFISTPVEEIVNSLRRK